MFPVSGGTTLYRYCRRGSPEGKPSGKAQTEWGSGAMGGAPARLAGSAGAARVALASVLAAALAGLAAAGSCGREDRCALPAPPPLSLSS